MTESKELFKSVIVLVKRDSNNSYRLISSEQCMVCTIKLFNL